MVEKQKKKFYQFNSIVMEVHEQLHLICWDKFDLVVP